MASTAAIAIFAIAFLFIWRRRSKQRLAGGQLLDSIEVEMEGGQAYKEVYQEAANAKNDAITREAAAVAAAAAAAAKETALIAAKAAVAAAEAEAAAAKAEAAVEAEAAVAAKNTAAALASAAVVVVIPS